VRYQGRPGLSPAVAAMIAGGTIKKDDVILDIGCGTGTDCICLARWGFRRVVGIDPDAEAIRIGRARATRLRLNRRVQFLIGRPEDLPADLAESGVDVALHTLVANNLDSGFQSHFRAIARALKPTGLLIVSSRTFAFEANLKPGALSPPIGMRRYFEVSPSVSSHLAESSRYFPGYTPVAIWLGRPKRRPSTRTP